MYKHLLFVLTLLFTVTSMDLEANGVRRESLIYKVTIKLTSEELLVKTNIHSDTDISKIVLNSQAIHNLEFEKIDNASTRWSKDTLFFLQPVRSISISYSLDKSFYTFGDNTIMLKREGKWYPIIPNSIFNASININYPVEDFFWVSGGIYDSHNSKVNCVSELSLLLLPRQVYTMSEYKKENINFTFFHYKTSKSKPELVNEFLSSLEFFQEFFGSPPPYDKISAVHLGDEKAMLAQALNGMIIFGNYFYKMFESDPTNSWIPHEVCHQWWAKGVLLDSNAPYYRFMEESITEYLKALYVFDKYGEKAFNQLIQNYTRNYEYVFRERTLLSFKEIVNLSNKFETVTIYCKGPLVLYEELHKYERVFKSTMQKLYQQKQLVNFNTFLRYLQEEGVSIDVLKQRASIGES